MAKLVALDFIQVGFCRFRPGDTLPSEDQELAAAWVESGSAVWRADDYTPPTWAKARQATAPSGLPGLAVGGEQTGDDLVGRVPKTHERTRGRWKA